MTVEHVGKHGIEYGRQLLLPLFFFVPRSVWPDKPVGSGYHVSLDWPLTSHNVSSPLVAEGFLNFGLPGSISFLFILGMLVRKVDLSIEGKRHDIMTYPVYGYFIFNLYILLRGDLNTAVNYFLPVLLCSAAYRIAARWRPIRHTDWRVAAMKGEGKR